MHLQRISEDNTDVRITQNVPIHTQHQQETKQTNKTRQAKKHLVRRVQEVSITALV